MRRKLTKLRRACRRWRNKVLPLKLHRMRSKKASVKWHRKRCKLTSETDLKMKLTEQIRRIC